jgi:DNA primase
VPYDQSFIDELKNRTDLVRLIEPLSALKKKGANWMGRCPFHQEKTPSFSVNPGKGFYKCFGCGKGGNAFSFVMETEGLSFPEAVRRLAEFNGIPIPEQVDDERFRASKTQRDEKKRLADSVTELNGVAMEFWEKNLQSGTPQANAALKYLEDRGLSKETIEEFRIGFADDSWDSLLSHLRAIGTEEALMTQSGLVSVSEDGEKVFDRFRGRIIFPVINANGFPVAFGARILGAGEPKYLNSPETPAYTKGDHLYGLFQSKTEVRRLGYGILVEGYLDLIALSQNGVKNAVASLGTAFTENQARLLARFARKVVVNYDGDKAGVKAAKRAVEVLLAENFDVKVLVLPNGDDPDDFIRSNGYTAYKEQHKTQSTTYLQFVLESAVQNRNLGVPKQKAEAIEEVIAVLTFVPKGIQRREAFDQTMDFFRIEDISVKADLWKSANGRIGEKTEAVRIRIAKASALKTTVAEERLLEMLIHDEELRQAIVPLVEEADYAELASASLFAAVLECNDRPGFIGALRQDERITQDEATHDLLSLIIMSEPFRGDGDALDESLIEAQRCLLTLRAMAFTRAIGETARQLMAAEQNKDKEETERLANLHLGLARMKQEIEKRLSELKN